MLMFTKSIKISGAISYANTAITIIIGIVITPTLIGSMGLSEYGLYTLVAGLIMLMATFDFGLSGTVTRFVAKYRTEKNSTDLQNTIDSVQILFAALYVIILVTGFTFILINKNETVFSLTAIESEKALILISILLPSIPAVMQTAIYTAILNGSELFIFPRALQLIRHIVRTTLIIIAIRTGCDSVILVTIDATLTAASLTITSIYSKKSLEIQPHLKLPDFEFLIKLTKYSLWLFIWSASMQFFWQIGQLSVASNISVSSVTIYALCIMLGTYYGAFVGAYATMFMPTATRHVKSSSSPEELGAACSKIGKVNAGILFFILGGFISTGKIFLHLWLGDEFDESSITAIWLGSILIMIGYTVPLTQSFFNQLLEANGLVKYKAIICIIFLPTSGLIASCYANTYGVVGVISIMLAFWLTSQILINFYYHYSLKINISRFFIESYGSWLLPLAVACLATYPLTRETTKSLINMSISALIYATCFILTYLAIEKNLFAKKKAFSL